MLYRQKFDTFIRSFGDVGYISNKSNFHNRVVDSSGAVFLEVLSRKGQTIDNLTGKILQKFTDIDVDTIKNDIIDFYAMLENDGFIVSGENEVELEAKDKHFSYSALQNKSINGIFTSEDSQSEKTTLEFLEEHFRDKPYLSSFQIELSSRCNERSAI